MIYTKIRNYVTILIFYLALILSSCSQEDPLPAQPNIIFIFSDDHVSHAVSAYGSEIIETPHMDRLADEAAIS